MELRGLESSFRTIRNEVLRHIHKQRQGSNRCIMNSSASISAGGVRLHDTEYLNAVQLGAISARDRCRAKITAQNRSMRDLHVQIP